MTDNTCPLRITATAGTKLVGAYFSGKITIYPGVRMGREPPPQGSCRLVYDPKAFFLPHPRSRLDQAFAHCPKFLTAAQGAGTLFDSGVAVRSRKPAGDLWLGEPLPPTDLLIPGGIDHWRTYFTSADLLGWMMAPSAIVSGIWVSRDQWVDCSP